MKNWKTTVLGLLGAGLVLATSKGWIDQDIAAFIGTALIAIFGAVSKDFNVSGSKLSVSADDIGGGGIQNPPKKQE